MSRPKRVRRLQPVKWKPVLGIMQRKGQSPEHWMAYLDGAWVGRVTRLRTREAWEVSVPGNRIAYFSNMTTAARAAVARINNIYPSQLPR